MPDYCRPWIPGGTFFFTVNLWRCEGSTLLVDHILLLRASIRSVRKKHPFIIHGWVVLPDHMHCLFTLPEGEFDFALRWRLIKGGFSKRLPFEESNELRSAFRRKRGARGIWQRRYWEHRIRDQDDFNSHMDYIHVNSMKHGLVSRVRDWSCSTFHRSVGRGIYPLDWVGGVEGCVDYND